MRMRRTEPHHADPDYDLTTGARIHPIEIVLSMLIFEVLLYAAALFHHGHTEPREVARFDGMLLMPFREEVER